MSLKTTVEWLAALKEAVLKSHPSELPEIVAVNLSDGHGPYLDWILNSTK